MYKDLMVYIVRHGETNENRQGIIQGQMDTQLNDAGKPRSPSPFIASDHKINTDIRLPWLGKAQAKLAGRTLKDVNFVKAYSSDSSRAADTARAIVAHHPACDLILDRRIRERNMGSLSGTKAPAKRPLPPDIETSESVGARLLDFWANAIIPLLTLSASASNNGENSNTEPSTTDLAAHVSSQESRTPAVLVVSHGATISKLLTHVLLRTYGYEAACEMRRAIHNTSISIVRMSATWTIPKAISGNNDNDVEGNAQPMVSVSGVLTSCASIAHLVRKHDIVTTNADLLER